MKNIENYRHKYEGDITDKQYGWIIHYYPWLNKDDVSNFTKQEAFEFIKNKKKPGFLCYQWYLYKKDDNYFIGKTHQKNFNDLCKEVNSLNEYPITIKSRLYANKRLLLEDYGIQKEDDVYQLYSNEKKRYLKCEDLLGNWWYKDLNTGKDLPLSTTPILGLGVNND